MYLASKTRRERVSWIFEKTETALRLNRRWSNIAKRALPGLNEDPADNVIEE